MRSTLLLKEEMTTLYMLMVLRRGERVVMAVLGGWGWGLASKLVGLTTVNSNREEQSTQANMQVGIGVVVGTLRSSLSLFSQ